MDFKNIFEYLEHRLPAKDIPVNWDDTGYTSESLCAWANEPSFSGWQDEHDTEIQTEVIAKLLNFKRRQTLLDVCCGYGRHSLIFADKYGLAVTGIDISPGLINAAKRFAAKKKLNITFENKHAAELSGNSVFNNVIIVDNSLSLIAPEKAPEVLKKINKALKPGGGLFLDLDNKPYNCRYGTRETHWYQYPVDLVLQEIYFHEDISVEASRDINFRKDSEEVGEFIIFKRIYSRDEIKSLLADNGFRAGRVYGDWGLSYLSEKSPKMILAGVKEI